MEEEWRDVIGFENYLQVSSLGRVLSKERFSPYIRKNRSQMKYCKSYICKPGLTKAGYVEIALCIEGVQKKFRLHRLIGKAFVPGYEQGFTINHINGNKSDNRIENLEWVTQAENTKHEWRIGLCDLRGSKHPRSKLTENAVKRIKSGENVISLAKEFGVARNTIYKVKYGINWAHI